MGLYIDAGTTYTKIISTDILPELEPQIKTEQRKFDYNYYVIESKDLKNFNNKEVAKFCGHMSGTSTGENEIIALAKGAANYIKDDRNAPVLDLGSRDAKWVSFRNGKFNDMDWNTSCASSTGATVEMLLKFYDLKVEDLEYTDEKFVVTCGIFGLEKIMDSISKGEKPSIAVSKFVHGIAYNAWNFAKKPQKLYLSGGFCNNLCLVKSLKKYCEVIPLGRFVLCEGLIDE